MSWISQQWRVVRNRLSPLQLFSLISALLVCVMAIGGLFLYQQSQFDAARETAQRYALELIADRAVLLQAPLISREQGEVERLLNSLVRDAERLQLSFVSVAVVDVVGHTVAALEATPVVGVDRMSVVLPITQTDADGDFRNLGRIESQLQFDRIDALHRAQLRERTILLLLALAAIFCLGGVVYYYTVYRGQRQLLAAFSAALDGNRQQISWSRNDLLGRIATQFNFLAKSYQRELVNSRNDQLRLEEKIVRRTSALERMMQHNKFMSRDLHEQQQRYEAVFKSIPQCIVIVNGKAEVEYINPAARRLLGVQNEAVLGGKFTEFFVTPDAPSALQQCLQSKQAAQNYKPIRLTLKAGELYVQDFAEPVFSEDGKLISIAINFTDVTSLWRREANLDIPVSHDDISTLLTRNTFERRAEYLLGKLGNLGRECTMIAFDISCLDGLNAKFGHFAGDQILRYCGNLLRDVSRSTDLVARCGSDEFLLLSFGLSSDKAHSVVTRLYNNLQRRPFTWGGEPVAIELTCGIFSFTAGECTLSEAMRGAQRAYLPLVKRVQQPVSQSIQEPQPLVGRREQDVQMDEGPQSQQPQSPEASSAVS